MPDPPCDPGTAGPEANPARDATTAANALGTLGRALVSLLAGKLRLAEIELSRDLTGLRTAAALLIALALLLAMGLIFAGAGAGLLLGEAMGSAALGLLVVAGIYLLSALVLYLAARRRLKRLHHFLGETRADLKRDIEWLRSLQ